MSEEVKTLSLVMVGDSGCGKTCIVNRYLNDVFNPDQDLTTGASYFKKDTELINETFKLNIWDTSGQPRYESIFNLYSKTPDAFIIVCDVKNEDPLSSLSNWHNKIMSNTIKENPSLVIFINKSDLETSEHKDNIRKIEEFGDSQHIPVIKGSALDNINIDYVFKKIFRMILNIPSTMIRKSLTLNIKRHSIKIIENEQRRKTCCN